MLYFGQYGGRTGDVRLTQSPCRPSGGAFLVLMQMLTSGEPNDSRISCLQSLNILLFKGFPGLLSPEGSARIHKWGVVLPISSATTRSPSNLPWMSGMCISNSMPVDEQRADP